MRDLTAGDNKRFLAEQGYEWWGYVAEPTGDNIDEYEVVDQWVSNLNKQYIVLGSQYGWDDIISSNNNPYLKYVKQGLLMFKVYAPTTTVDWELEKDLTFEWIKYQTLNVEGYAEKALKICSDMQCKASKNIEQRGSLFGKMMKCSQESIKQDQNDMADINQYRVIEEFIRDLKQDLQV